MSLRATKNMERTPLGYLKCINQGLGDEKRVSATYAPLQFSPGDMGVSVIGPEFEVVKLDSVLDGVIPVFDRLDGGKLGGRSNDICSPVLSPISACPVSSVSSGHLSCFRMGIGEDKRVSAIYSPAKVMGDRDLLCMGPMHEDYNPGCSESGSFQASACLEGGVKRGG